MTGLFGMNGINLEDYFGIHQIEAQYGHVLDRCIRGKEPWINFTALFVDDCLFDMTDLGLGKIEGAVALTEAMKIGVHPAGHHIGNLFVRSLSRDVAEVVVKSILVIFDGRACTGTYEDTLHRTATGWKFAVRRPWIEKLDKDAPLPLFITG